MAVLDDTIIDLDIDVNLTNCYISSVHVNQYEHNGDENNGRNVKCKIYKNGLPFILPDISLIYITATRKDGTQIFQTLQDFDLRCRIEDEYIVIPIIDKLTCVEGRVTIQILFRYSDETMIYTNPFYINVHPASIKNDDVMSSNIFGILNDYVTSAEQSAKYAEKCADDAKNYSDDSKKYADDAEKSAIKSEEFAKNIEKYSLISEGYATGTQNGNEVDETSPYYNNSSKYYYGYVKNSFEEFESQNIASEDDVADVVSVLYDNEEQDGDV